tara:strand:- start:6 stop:524 length:519 start_codon:yes stop_codon:yes gene_type:complete
MKKKPVVTNMLTGLVLGFSGDLACQKVLEKREDIDLNRLYSLTTFCTLYHGVINPIIYNSYSKIIPKIMQSNSKRFAVSCTLVDNFIHVPILYTPTFFISTSLLRGNDWASSYKSMLDGLIPSVTACWVMWIPLQFINFAYFPPHMRPTVVNIGCLVWNVAIDHISHDFIDQ